VYSAARQHANELQPDRAAANQDDRVAGMHIGFLDAAQHAGQWFDHGGIEKRNVRRNFQQVLTDDAPRDADIFRVGAIVEEQILAEIAAALTAKQAGAAGSRVGRDDAISDVQGIGDGIA